MPSAWFGPQTNQCRQTRPLTGPWEPCDSIRQEHALVLPRCAKNGSSAHREATMFKTKCFAFVVSVLVVSFGSVTSWAQQPPPQSPDVTFFVTSIGPGKGADLR